MLQMLGELGGRRWDPNAQHRSTQNNAAHQERDAVKSKGWGRSACRVLRHCHPDLSTHPRHTRDGYAAAVDHIRSGKMNIHLVLARYTRGRYQHRTCAVPNSLLRCFT